MGCGCASKRGKRQGIMAWLRRRPPPLCGHRKVGFLWAYPSPCSTAPPRPLAPSCYTAVAAASGWGQARGGAREGKGDGSTPGAQIWAPTPLALSDPRDGPHTEERASCRLAAPSRTAAGLPCNFRIRVVLRAGVVGWGRPCGGQAAQRITQELACPQPPP